MTKVARSGLVVAAFGLLVTAGCTSDLQPPGTPSGTPSETTVVAKPPTPGSVTETVSAPPVQPPREAEVDDTVTLSGGVEVAVVDLDSAEVSNPLPGESGGPAVVATISVTNNDSTGFTTGQLEVSLLDSRGYAAERVTAEPARPLPATVEPGASAQGVYVFLVPEEHRDPIKITVGAPGVQNVEFTGTAPA